MSEARDQVKTEMRVRYDRFATTEADGEHVGPARAYFRSRKLETALVLGAFRTGADLLEIGCARGQFTLPLGRRGFRVTGLDLSPASIEVARRRASEEGLNIAFVTGDAERLDSFPADRFDGVVSFSTLRYVPNLPAALAEIRRVLRPSGRAVLDFPNRLCPWFYVKQWLGSERHPYDHWYTAGALDTLFRRAGLRAVRARHILFTPTIAPDRFLSLFRAIDAIGERLPGVRCLAGIVMMTTEK